MEAILSFIRLTGGSIHDPTNGVDGEIRDLWIENGKIVSAPSSPTANVISHELTGRVVMPGAVDMHCHIAGPKVNAARMMQPHESRKQDGSFRFDSPMSSVPDIFTTGLRYTGLGYTSCFDAAVTPLASRMVRNEIQDAPNLDTGFYVLVGNNHYAMNRIAAGDSKGLQAFLGWLLNRCGAFAPKLVNPGGVEMWKQMAGGNARDLDQNVTGFDVTPRQILEHLSSAANELDLPHPLHVHCNNLGIPGNYTTTLETMKSLQGRRAHLTHIQFHSYGGGDADESRLCSKVAPLAEYVNAHPELTVDVGQVMFGETINMTADGPLGYYLHSIGGQQWFSADIELESGCGIAPINYKRKSFVHALQWAIGLQWYLSVKNPWQLAMSSDHPNGGSFLAYPQIIRLLMDSAFRREQLDRVNPQVLKCCPLADMQREYSLNEIAIITRAAPAKMLGLKHKGHLGIGADADITIYSPDNNFETMFAWPYMVFKHGQLVMSEGEFRSMAYGELISSRPDYDKDCDPNIESWFEQKYSLPLKPI